MIQNIIFNRKEDKMKTRLFNLMLLLIAGMIAFNCAGSRKGPDLSPDANRKTIHDAPAWYTNPPVKDGYRYEAATATSQDMQLAIDKARSSAATALAGLVHSEWNGLTKRAQEETGLGPDSHLIDQFSQTQEQVISTELRDLRVAETIIQEEKSDVGKIYRGYVLVEFDETAANKRLLLKIKENEQLYTLMRTTEMFDEMEKKVEEYRQRYDR